MMNVDNNDVEVDFETFCKKCEYLKTPENRPPCDECLEYPVNDGTSKPTRYKEATK